MSASLKINDRNVEAESKFNMETHYVETDAEARKTHDHRSAKNKALDLASSLFQEISYGITIGIPGRLGFGDQTYNLFSNPVWKPISQGLFVLVHGLNGHPSIWNGHIDELRKTPQFDLYVPHVPNKGNCTLEVAGQPILDKILTYTAQHPSQPVFLGGVSNGGRIVVWLEVQMRSKAATTAVRVSSIAGVLFGSSRIDLIRNSCLLKVTKCSTAVLEELAYGSEKACSLLDSARELSPKDPPRIYEIHASTEDLLIPHLALARLPNRQPPNIVHGYGHSSIVAAVQKTQLAAAKTWMELRQRSLIIKTEFNSAQSPNEDVLSIILAYEGLSYK